MTKEFGPKEAGQAFANVETQMIELASQRTARHVEYSFEDGNILDIKVDYPLTKRTYLKILKRYDRIPACLLLNTISNHDLVGYLTDSVTGAMIRGDRGYRYLDILAVGDDEKANEFADYFRKLIKDGNEKARLFLQKGSRTFETRFLSIGNFLSSSDAVGTFSLEVKPTLLHSVLHSGPSPIRLCVLAKKAYEEMKKPFNERKA